MDAISTVIRLKSPSSAPIDDVTFQVLSEQQTAAVAGVKNAKDPVENACYRFAFSKQKCVPPSWLCVDSLT
eukprot:272342-Hanusia_phi.AAC.2